MNRVADDRVRNRAVTLGETPKPPARPVCGACKTHLDTKGAPQPVAGEAFERAIAASPVPVLVDFWAEWCGPCRMAAPAVAEVAQRNAGRLLVLKVNVDEDGSAARKYRIQGIPAFVLFEGGREVARRAGLASAVELEAWIARSAPRAA
jgi:thioredoxin 2